MTDGPLASSSRPPGTFHSSAASWSTQGETALEFESDRGKRTLVLFSLKFRLHCLADEKLIFILINYKTEILNHSNVPITKILRMPPAAGIMSGTCGQAFLLAGVLLRMWG